MIVMDEKHKALIGTTCPQCKKGKLKKKHNRQVKPAKPFIGCTNYPKCYYSMEVNDKMQRIRDEEMDIRDLDECWDEDHGQS